MRPVLRFALLLAAAAAFSSPTVVADQGKSGDSTDWGCGGHPATAATLTTGTTNGHKGAFFTDQAAWRNWWYLNRPTLLDVSYRVDERDPAAPKFEKWRDDVRAALREAIDSPVVPLASAAALALGRGGDVRDTELLEKNAGDVHRQQNVRRRAALALGLLPVDSDAPSAMRTRDTLFRIAREAVGNNDDRLELWAFSVYALGLRGDIAALPHLRDFVNRYRERKDTDDFGVHREVMGAAVGTLGLFREPMLVPDLVDVMSDASGSGNIRQRKAMFGVFAAYGLARVGDKAALPALCRCALDDRSEVRRGAMLALGALAGADDANAVGMLVASAAREKDDAARGFAALSLGRTCADVAPAALRSAYASGSSSVRAFSALGLGLYARNRPDAAVQAFLLEELRANHDTYETGALCIANGLARNLPSAPRLVQIAREPGDSEMRSHAAFALGLLGMEGVSPKVLLELVEKGDGVIRHEAGLALGLARRPDGIEALMRIVARDGGLPERGSAAVVLGRIAGPEAAPLLMKILRDEHEVNAMRICATHGLGLLLDRTEGRKLGLLGADVNWINEVNRVFLPTEVLDQLLLIMD